MPLKRGENAIARLSQLSWQLRHSIPLNGRQLGEKVAFHCQGASSNEVKTDASQAVTQRRQKVHSARWKSISGKPPLPTMSTPVSQAVTQAWQRVQPAVKSASSTDQGGRIIEDVLPELRRHCPESSRRRDKLAMLIPLTLRTPLRAVLQNTSPTPAYLCGLADKVRLLLPGK
ncbi:Ferredoxin-type protein NapF [Yersinia ruckeri ATCC 29473]|nr:Ferredoxin-type protein NapF [Yersinia ruckeri ATCC 29473]